MAMVGSEIERLIREAFPDAQVIVVDLAGDGDHFAARITSEDQQEPHPAAPDGHDALQDTWAEPSMLSLSRPRNRSDRPRLCIKVCT
jgi:hypothetical protein